LCGAPAAFAPICLIFKDKSIEKFFVAFTLSRPVKGVDRRFAAEASERRRAGGANRRWGGNYRRTLGEKRLSVLYIGCFVIFWPRQACCLLLNIK